MRFGDPDGRDIRDFLLGVVHSIGSNLSLGTTNTSTNGSVSNAGDYNAGRNVGDVISMAMGVAAMDVGGGAAAGAAVADIPTGGATTGIVLAGAGFASHGYLAATKAAKSLMLQDGRISQAEATRGSGDKSSSENKTKREAPAKSREKWENATGEKWPKEPNNPSKNQDVSHKKALADGGTNDVDNFGPKPHEEHMQEHKDNGDFKRWGQRRNE